MGLIVKDTGGGDFELVPQGTHLAVCYMVADIGLQESSWGIKHKVVLGFEIPGEMMVIDGEHKPMIINNMYTASLSKKANLRQDLEGWRGQAFTDEELAGFDLKNVLGKSCMITVVHNVNGDRTWANITSISALPKGVEPSEATRLLFYSEDETNQFNDLPKWVQEKIKNQVKQEQPAQEKTEQKPAFDDDIPF